ncbi:MAG: hypothetical protein ACTSR8_01425 [Promethearchaeota archaeon]
MKMKYLLIGILSLFILISLTSGRDQSYNYNNLIDDDNKFDLIEKPKSSAFIGNINLTNQEVNNTRYYHNSVLIIRGKITLFSLPDSGRNLILKVDGVYKAGYTAISNASGEFRIDYTIESSLDVFKTHKIQVNCTDNLGGAIKILNHYNINVNATSYFQVNPDPTTALNKPYLVGETIILNGYLRQDSGIGIGTAVVNKYFQNSTYQWNLGSFTTIVDGGFPNNPVDNRFTVPDTPSSAINIKLNYSGQNPEINQSEIILPSIGVFKNITCNWDIPAEAKVGDDVTISGQILALNHPTMQITHRDLTVYYDGQVIDTITTDANGKFSVDYEIPDGTGTRDLQIILDSQLAVNLISSQTIEISEANPEKKPSVANTSPQAAPFEIFLMYFIPIIIGIAGVLIFFGYRFLKKQEKESRIVELPLQNRLLNLKILKDSGRLEEALSYLFNAIYMDLVSAKYNRRRTPTETIRDFAIISVKELKLNPAIIYPFIQKIEEIIYARPTTTDLDFYDAISLFSPVYFELTGYNFILNF